MQQQSMMMSDDVSGIMPAFVAAFAEVGTVTKTQEAKVATKAGGEYRYAYADIGVTLEAVRPVLAKHGLAVAQNPSTEWPESGGAVMVHVETWVVHGSGQWMRGVLSLRPAGSDPQSIGSAITYARRYALLAMLGVATEDDDGKRASARRQEGAPEQEVDTAAVAAAAEVFARLRDLGKRGPEFRAYVDEHAPDHPAMTVPKMVEVPGWRAKLAGLLDEFEQTTSVDTEAERSLAIDAEATRAAYDDGHPPSDGDAPSVRAAIVNRVQALPDDQKRALREWALEAHGVRSILHPKRDEEAPLLAWLDEHAPEG